MFFFNDTATTEIYTLSLHDALPICPDDPPGDGDGGRDPGTHRGGGRDGCGATGRAGDRGAGIPPRRPHSRLGHDATPRDGVEDRKSTRLNSSHANISYAVFCLKKKK